LTARRPASRQSGAAELHGAASAVAILSTEEESAYYALVDEYLDRLHAEATARPELVRPAKAPTLDDVASA